VTCILGSLLASVAIFASSFAPSLITLILTYGVLGGVGLGLMYVPAMVAVSQYFSRRLSFATGLCVTGSGVGTFLFAPLASALVQWGGWRGCNRVMALICTLGLLCGLALKPRKTR
jgi:MFS family permease